MAWKTLIIISDSSNLMDVSLIGIYWTYYSDITVNFEPPSFIFWGFPWPDIWDFFMSVDFFIVSEIVSSFSTCYYFLLCLLDLKFLSLSLIKFWFFDDSIDSSLSHLFSALYENLILLFVEKVEGVTSRTPGLMRIWLRCGVQRRLFRLWFGAEYKSLVIASGICWVGGGV